MPDPRAMAPEDSLRSAREGQTLPTFAGAWTLPWRSSRL